MDIKYLRELLESVEGGNLSVEDALDQLKDLPFDDMGFVKIDQHRNLRTGYPEVIFCQGKQTDQIIAIMKKMMESNTTVLGTRAAREVFEQVHLQIPEAVYYDAARIIAVVKEEGRSNPSVNTAGAGNFGKQEQLHLKKSRQEQSDLEKQYNMENPNQKQLDLEKSKQEKIIAVVTAGTADIPVAEEAAITAEMFGNQVDRIYDVGVAGIHRLFAQLPRIRKANVLIVIAGMEGALASVVGGLVDRPVIAVPTSVGYGASFGGISSLLTMLNSCAAGVGVVNIDNGFGAAYLASNINQS